MIKTGEARMKREEQDTQHLRYSRKFTLPKQLDGTISGALAPLIGPGTALGVARTEVSEVGAHLTP